MEGATLSERLLRENRDAWDAMQAHRFVQDVASDRLPADVFRRYLVYEGAFVDTAIVIFGQALVKAPGIGAQRWLAGVLQALTGEQVSYFEQAYVRLGIDPAAHALPEAVTAFRSGMAEIAAEGGYLDIVAAMFAAEWMYWTWCERASRGTIGEPMLREWVDLHAAPAFAAQARWLKDQLDAAGAGLDAGERARLSALFGRVLRLEIDFHTAPYGT